MKPAVAVVVNHLRFEGRISQLEKGMRTFTRAVLLASYIDHTLSFR